MKKRPAKFSVKDYLASLQKPIHISDKKALKAQAATVTEQAIKKAQQELPDPMNLASVTKEQMDVFMDFMTRPRSQAVMRARAASAVVFLIADLKRRTRPPKG